MRNRFLFVAVVLILLTPTALAQADSPRSWGYVFAAPGGVFAEGESEGFFHFGGGGEGLLAGGLGVAGELGVMALSGDFADSSIGVFSPGLVYAFNRDQKAVPILTGGYSLFFRSGSASGAFLGGGLNYWLGERFGLRFEVRDHMYFCEGETANLVEGRFALLIR